MKLNTEEEIDDVEFIFDKEKAFKEKLELYSKCEDEETQAYYRYLLAFGDCDAIPLLMPTGHPKEVKEYGGAIKVYNDCVKKGVKWEELLDYKPPVYNPNVIL